jgi:hypothetical protein
MQKHKSIKMAPTVALGLKSRVVDPERIRNGTHEDAGSVFRNTIPDSGVKIDL